MKFTEIYLEGAYVIETEPRHDDRGSFERSFCAKEFGERALRTAFVQSNLSKSKSKHTIRGMHFQMRGAEEAKLVRCIKGKIWDVIIDIRSSSETYTKHFGIELSEGNNKLLYVPEGFAHGFITLEENSEVIYQVSNYYTPGKEEGIRWNDPLFNIQWPTTEPIISAKDASHPNYIPIVV